MHREGYFKYKRLTSYIQMHQIISLCFSLTKQNLTKKDQLNLSTNRYLYYNVIVGLVESHTPKLVSLTVLNLYRCRSILHNLLCLKQKNMIDQVKIIIKHFSATLWSRIIRVRQPYLPLVSFFLRLFLLKYSLKFLSGTGTNFPTIARGQLVKRKTKIGTRISDLDYRR